jgi:uncharacterized protein with FMN-binding domain
MRRAYFRGFAALLSTALSLVLSSCAGSSASPYKDGHYEGVSRSVYTSEAYFGKASFDVKEGRVQALDFVVEDRTRAFSSQVIPFDGSYEKYYAGNRLYAEQSRLNWAGIGEYVKRFRERQDIDKLDVISGATWAYNLFKDSVKAALGK